MDENDEEMSTSLHKKLQDVHVRLLNASSERMRAMENSVFLKSLHSHYHKVIHNPDKIDKKMLAEIEVILKKMKKVENDDDYRKLAITNRDLSVDWVSLPEIQRIVDQVESKDDKKTILLAVSAKLTAYEKRLDKVKNLTLFKCGKVKDKILPFPAYSSITMGSDKLPAASSVELKRNDVDDVAESSVHRKSRPDLEEFRVAPVKEIRINHNSVIIGFHELPNSLLLAVCQDFSLKVLKMKTSDWEVKINLLVNSIGKGTSIRRSTFDYKAEILYFTTNCISEGIFKCSLKGITSENGVESADLHTEQFVLKVSERELKPDKLFTNLEIWSRKNVLLSCDPYKNHDISAWNLENGKYNEACSINGKLEIANFTPLCCSLSEKSTNKTDGTVLAVADGYGYGCVYLFSYHAKGLWKILQKVISSNYPDPPQMEYSMYSPDFVISDGFGNLVISSSVTKSVCIIENISEATKTSVHKVLWKNDKLKNTPVAAFLIRHMKEESESPVTTEARNENEKIVELLVSLRSKSVVKYRYADDSSNGSDVKTNNYDYSEESFE